MASTVSSSAKLALYGGALAGPMSVVAILFAAVMRLPSSQHVSTSPLELVAVCSVALLIGVVVALIAGFPVFFLLSRFGVLHPGFVVAWSGALGALGYHAFFMWGGRVDLAWVSTGAVAGAIAGGTAALLLRSRRGRGDAL